MATLTRQENPTDQQGLIQCKSTVTFQSGLGWFGVVMTPEGIERLHFGHSAEEEVLELISEEYELSNSTPPKWWKDSQKLLLAFAFGESVDLSKIPTSLGRRTPFQQKVVHALLKVGYGQTVTYAELAARAGSAGAARAVGNQMAKNCVPLIIPCHRVVGSGGKLGGFSAPQGLTMKRRLLNMENDQSQLPLDLDDIS
ncbi:methylated-DNA--[protein]-cysteine S-methyltransferase [Thalassoglobus polymorphus]|uniref:methylated-DNA--[protein]-cysteine S-methyltransferase n=1 Tax=Thalassoglobus polymorphus TaxID=2527994 RepID=A0A517QR78_9PLAN|nr:methylated-DNA--[protein]-cysteine S-methyltransferase [Thalassoglobus polymorphus]QDT34115.1 Methylated-DNA--protein-cysteine methyltransferase [Thalassoglobus polymorphus]